MISNSIKSKILKLKYKILEYKMLYWIEKIIIGIISLTIFIVWCEIGIGNVFYRTDLTGEKSINIKQSIYTLGSFIIKPLVIKEFWTTNLIMFNFFIYLLFSLLIYIWMKYLLNFLTSREIFLQQPNDDFLQYSENLI